MQSLTTRQPQGCNHLVTCIENFNATGKLPNKASENHDITGKIIFPDMREKMNVHCHDKSPVSMIASRFLGQIHRKQYSDYLLRRFKKICVYCSIPVPDWNEEFGTPLPRASRNLLPLQVNEKKQVVQSDSLLSMPNTWCALTGILHLRCFQFQVELVCR